MRNLPDVQQSSSGFPFLRIENVGVENIKMQLPIKEKSGKIQNVVANIKSYCSLEKSIKGINMSRIGQVVGNYVRGSKDGIANLNQLANELRKAHESESVYVSAEFDYIVEQVTPVTGLPSDKVAKVTLISSYENHEMKSYLRIKTTEMSLCPCSKEMSLLKNQLSDEELNELDKLTDELKNKILMSGYGAHNQKSDIEAVIEIKDGEEIYIDDLVGISGNSASAPTYSILKRPDEKWVTEVSYLGGYWSDDEFIEVGGGPKFVEDIIRGLGEKYNEMLDVTITDFMLSVRNYESIHDENIVAFANMTANRNMKMSL